MYVYVCVYIYIYIHTYNICSVLFAEVFAKLPRLNQHASTVYEVREAAQERDLRLQIAIVLGPTLACYVCCVC